jgi:hypothetical protein
MGSTWQFFWQELGSPPRDMELTDAREQCMQRVIEKAAAIVVKKSGSSEEVETERKKNEVEGAPRI